MPRRTDHQPEFGSDSFLDIVANIVGILIILIVVAGVRVARAPILPTVESPVAETETSAAPEPVILDEPPEEAAIALSPNLDVEEPPEQTAIALPPNPEPQTPTPDFVAHPELPALPVYQPLEPVVIPEELRLQAAHLKVSNELLESKLADQKQALAEKEQTLTAARSDVTSRTGKLTGVDKAIQQHRLNLALGEQAVDDLERSVSLLKRELRDREKPVEETVKLEHQLTPVGRVVTGKEIHFQLAGNRVSYVPVMELADQIAHEFDRRKEYLLNRPFFQGTIGPVDGYLMDYLFQRESLSLVDEMRMGRVGARISLAGWQITPTADMVPETVEEALRGDSRFINKLREADPTSTVTLWVYPDSFEAHGQIKTYIHELGLWVASRPLPEGLPIQGSPNGSKSLAQ